MPRRPRGATGKFFFHVLNRAVDGMLLFETPGDYQRFLDILVAGMRLFPVRVFAYCLMPNHWHLVMSPCTDDALSGFMRWATAKHAQSWRRFRESEGRGAVYQGRYKAIAVQDDRHFVRLSLYVERNAKRGGLAERAEAWSWSSASPSSGSPDRPELTEWPIPRPADWLTRLNAPEDPRILDSIRKSVRANRHYGSLAWRRQTGLTLNWREGHRPPGRPRREVEASIGGHDGPSQLLIPLHPISVDNGERASAVQQPASDGRKPATSPESGFGPEGWRPEIRPVPG
jgi:putative transposase